METRKTINPISRELRLKIREFLKNKNNKALCKENNISYNKLQALKHGGKTYLTEDAVEILNKLKITIS